jgi:hypothetical protein
MRTIFQSLAWKEWHEHKWRLLSLTAILWSIAVLGLVHPERGTLIGIHLALTLAIVPLTVFVGLGTAASERSRGTLPFLQSLPVPMWRVAIHKLVAGLATFIVPALLTVAFVFAGLKLGTLMGIEYRQSFSELASGFRQDAPFVLTDHWYANTALMLTLVASGFYFWTIAAGVNRKDEVSAGAVALAVIMGWCVLNFTAWNVLYNWYGPFREWPSETVQWLAALGVATAPGGISTLIDATDGDSKYLASGLCVAAATCIFLAGWFVYRFGRVSDVEIRSHKTVPIGSGQLDWLGPPRRTSFRAIAWKQFRESGPLALVGVAVIVGIVAMILVVERSNSIDRLTHLFEVYAGVTASLGFAVAMIVGIGVFLYDVGPGLNTFWRSRPINPNLWFWTKLLSGLAIVLGAIYGPLVIAALPRITLAATVAGREAFSSILHGNSELLIFPALTAAIFAAAAAMTVLVRNAVYAAILSVAVVYLAMVAVAVALASARFLRGDGWPDGNSELSDLTAAQAAIGLLISTAISTLVAWLAVRNDWGQKSRY